MGIAGDTPQDDNQPHEAIFSESTAYFVFNFCAKKPFDIHKAADRLLRAGIAETVASPADGEVRVAHRYRDLFDLWQKAHTIAEVKALLDEGDYRGIARRHPSWAARLARAVITSKIRRASESSEDFVEDDSDPLSEAIQLIENGVTQVQTINAIQQDIERKIFRPAYLDNEPYLRLTLRATVQWLALLNGGERREAADLSQGQVANALLLMHRSGVIQITIAVRLPEKLSGKDFRTAIFGGSPLFLSSEIPEPLIVHAAQGRHERNERAWLGEWLPDTKEGVRWRRMTFEEPSTAAHLFTLYQDAIRNVTGVELFDEWQCHPVVCIDAVGCCASEERWLAMHPAELAALSSGGVEPERLRESAITALCPTERSLVKDHSLFTSPAKTIRIDWANKSADITFSDHLWTIVVIESALVQYWQLRALENRLSESQIAGADIQSLQQEAIYGLQEFRQSSFLFGTATDIADDLLRGWRAERLHQRILEALNQLQQLVATGETKRAGLRSNTFAAAAVIAALAFGLPAVNDTLGIIKTIPSDGPFGLAAEPVKALADQGNLGAWKGYISLLSLATVATLVLLLLKRRKPSRRQARQAGMEWPLDQLNYVEEEQSGEHHPGVQPDNENGQAQARSKEFLEWT
ncbi:hypothetical protein AB0B71_21455 [Micromonospora echinofusca]|uniref:hypothetical protein n=1 Tax=Micromonospora echinofusca TaxID=47858 RepID=UPI0033E3D66A